MIEKIISGGQTGVDRAALDVAINLNCDFGGWCPKGRIDESGIIPSRYGKLIEISGHFVNEKENYDQRTKCNITDSDGTLIIVPQLPLQQGIKDGTLLTIQEVRSQGKPFLIISLIEENIENCKIWINENQIKILNVAGPRESTCPGIYKQAVNFLECFLNELNQKISFQL